MGPVFNRTCDSGKLPRSSHLETVDPCMSCPLCFCFSNLRIVAFRSHSTVSTKYFYQHPKFCRRYHQHSLSCGHQVCLFNLYPEGRQFRFNTKVHTKAKMRETALLEGEQHRRKRLYQTYLVNIIKTTFLLTSMSESSSCLLTSIFIKAVARATALRLGLVNCPLLWQSGRDGWFLGKRYIMLKNSKTRRMRKVEIRNWPIKISTLGPVGQFLAYQTLLKTARLEQVAAYYRLHCEDLDLVRCHIACDSIVHRKNDEHIRHVVPFLFSCREKIAQTSKVEEAACVVLFLRAHFRQRAGKRAFARGLEVLIGKCEVRLQESQNFTPADWRSYRERPRWVDGRRGWTGLRPEEVVVRAIKSEGIGSEDEEQKKCMAEMRARYARFFPRGADRRLGEDRGVGEVIFWAGGA